MNAIRIILPLVATLLIILAAARSAAALENEAVRATIVSAAEGQIAFVDSVGAQRILTTTPDCEVTIDGRRATIDNLQSGMSAMLLVNRNMQCMQIVAASNIGRTSP